MLIGFKLLGNEALLPMRLFCNNGFPFRGSRRKKISQPFCPLCDKQVIAIALGQERINFACIFEDFPKLSESLRVVSFRGTPACRGLEK